MVNLQCHIVGGGSQAGKVVEQDLHGLEVVEAGAVEEAEQPHLFIHCLDGPFLLFVLLIVNNFIFEYCLVA